MSNRTTVSVERTALIARAKSAQAEYLLAIPADKDLETALAAVEANQAAKAAAEAKAAEAEAKAAAGKAAAIAKALKPSTGKGWDIAAAIAADPSVTKGDQAGAAGWSVANHKCMLSYLYNAGLLSPAYTAKLKRMSGGK